MTDVNAYLGRQYPHPPCWALVADVHARELGLDLNAYQAGASVRSIADAFRLALHTTDHGFARLPAPRELCVVLMGRSAKLGPHHCGVYTGGKVLHALDGITLHQDLASLRDGYPLLEFWGRP